MHSLSRWFVGTIALLGADLGVLHAQVLSVPVLPKPTVTQVVDDVAAHAAALESQSALITALSHAYAHVMQGFLPSAALTTAGTVYTDAFGQPFAVGTCGFQSWGPAGPLNVGSYTTVRSVPGDIAVPIQHLELWPLNLLQPKIPLIVYPVGWTHPVTAYFYSATFGNSQPHVGLALRFLQTARSQLIFIPMVQVPAGGLISASDASAFLGMLAVDGFATTSFANWALAQYALPVTIGGGATQSKHHAQTYGECDGDALMDCVNAAAATATSALNTEAQRHKDKIDQIMKDFAAGKTWQLGAWVAAGAVPGAIAGSIAPGVGNAAGAVLGGLVGATGGAIGWLFSTAGDADAAQQKIDQENQTHHDNDCGILGTFGNAVLDCVAEYCPDIMADVQAAVNDMMSSAGC